MRSIELSIEAGGALREILGVMIDQTLLGEGWAWDMEHVVTLEQHLHDLWTPEEWRALHGDARTVELELSDAALLLDGMAYTEAASADLPWIDMVRWTADFITAELRSHWTDDEWREFSRAR